jgi:uncharacterized membrane protein
MLIHALVAMPDVAQVDAFAEPWRRLYSHSPLVSTLVMFGHIAGLLGAGGLSLAIDRATLRATLIVDDERRRLLDELAPTRRLVMTALGVAIVSGVLLFFADVEAFATSPVFWVKMALVALLLANVVLTMAIEAALRDDSVASLFYSARTVRDQLWRRRRASAAVSVVLWLVLVLAGTALGSH